MKLRNKHTGEIVDLLEGHIGCVQCGQQIIIKPVAALDKEYMYSSLAELCEEWEDYEEPRRFYVECSGIVEEDYGADVWLTEQLQSIGNYFETKEEAERAVEKLKAWKRLRDNGFEFEKWLHGVDGLIKLRGGFGFCYECSAQDVADLDLLFGGEE